METSAYTLVLKKALTSTTIIKDSLYFYDKKNFFKMKILNLRNQQGARV